MNAVKTILAVGLIVVFAGAASATVTTVAEYTIGESDLDSGGSAATDGSTPGNTLVASTGTDATGRFTGTATFSSNAAPGSTLSLMITGGGNSTNRDYTAPTSVSTAQRTDNWGMEAWMYFPSTHDSAGQFLGYSLGYFNYQAWEVQRDAGTPSWYTRDNTLFNIDAGDYDRWVHTAIVIDGGTQKYFLDGALLYSLSATPGYSGNATYDDLWIGTANSYGGNNGWQGGIDGVRVFTFEAGQFSVDDLNLGGGDIPEPATMSLLALGGLGLLARRRRK